MPPTTAVELPVVKDHISRKYSAAVLSAFLLKKQTRNQESVYVPISTTEHVRRSRDRKERAANIRSKIAKIRRYIRTKCTGLATKYKRKQTYFLDMVYQGGVRLTKPKNETNNFNAFKSVIAYERRQAGLPPMTILQIQKEYRPQYDALDKEGMDDILEKYKLIQDKEKREQIKRPSMKEKTADVASSLSSVAGIFQGLKTRVGVDAVALVVKNRTEDFMTPQWIVTDARIMEYLRVIVWGWDPVHIGQRIEAFAVAGCDITAVCKTTKEQAELLKKAITRLVQDALDDACGTTNLVMQYERFDHLITLKYRVVIEGWPAGLEFQCPSKFHGDTNKLLPLHEAWKSGSTRFRKLTPDEFKEWTATRAKGLADGTIQVKARQPRSDAGVKRKKTVAGDESESEKDEDQEDEDEKESDGSDDERVASTTKPSKKNRVKVTPSGASAKTSGKIKASSKNQKSQVTASKAAEKSRAAKTAGTKKQAAKKSKKKERSAPQAHAELTSASDLAATEATDQNNVASADLPTPPIPRPKPRRLVPAGTSTSNTTLDEGNGMGELDCERSGNGHRPTVDEPAIVISATLAPTTPHGPTALFSHVGSTNTFSPAEVASSSLPTPPVAVSNSAIDPALLECPTIEGTERPVDNGIPASEPAQAHDNTGLADNSGPTAHLVSGHSTTPAATPDGSMATTLNANGKRPRDVDSRTGEREEALGRGRRVRMPRKLTDLGYE
ncbi:hypothetical protein PQX77_011906 [Marasmius sp. AFHP31]|nr:hypothetical protein PQX77_011906 [Marasmius sp. AFHP31]